MTSSKGKGWEAKLWEDDVDVDASIDGVQASLAALRMEHKEDELDVATVPLRRTSGARKEPSRPHAEWSEDSSIFDAGLDAGLNPGVAARLQKARVLALEGELSDVHSQLDHKDKALLAAERELKELLTEKSAWQKQHKAFEAQGEKHRQANDALAAKLESAGRANAELRKEIERLQRTNQKSETETRTRDVRLNRALEEVDKYKKALDVANASQRDKQDVAKKDYDRVVAEKKKLERQRAELLATFKKQLKLIDVLKKQKIHMEAARTLAFTEDEFLKALEGGLY